MHFSYQSFFMKYLDIDVCKRYIYSLYKTNKSEKSFAEKYNMKYHFPIYNSCFCIMLKTFVIGLLFFITPIVSFSQETTAYSRTNCFVENKGQIADSDGKLHPEVLFKSVYNDATLFFKNNGIVYLFTKFDSVSTEESIKEREAGNIARAKVLESKPMMFRMDLIFENTDPSMEIVSSGKSKEVSNYYLAHCPSGIMNVSQYDSITYKNIYHNIDITFYYTLKGLKYDITVHPGGNISDISYRYDGANEVAVNKEGELEINYADGKLMTEEKPVVFFADNTENKIQISYNVDSVNGTIRFVGENNTFLKTLIIDPAITWATYFHNTNSANSSWTNTEYDASGNFFMADQTYDAAFPLVNPGGGAWYDAAHLYMIKIAVLKFNSNRTLVWSTYYGGDKMNCLAGCTDYGKALALDNSGNVYVAGYTDPGTTVFPTYDPGGGAFYQDQNRCYGETSYFLKFNTNGVRQWATMFTHETASTSGTMIRVNGITCDGTNLFFTGQQYNWTPANTIPLRNPGGGAHYQTTILGDQDVFVGKFSSTSVLVWDTYLHSTNPANTAYGQGLDLHCDASGNLFVTGRESGANSHHYLLNPGGGAYYQATKGANGDLFITKFNTSLAVTWSTYYGGNGMDIPSTVEPDGAGNIYIVGRVTQSTDFPTYNPGGGALYQAAKSNAASDGFLIKLTAATCVRTWATYLGANVPTAGSDENHFYGIACSTSDNHVFIMGDTPSNTITTLNKAGSYNQAAIGGGYDMFFYEFDNAGVTQWASYYGGGSNEQFYNGRIGSLMTGCGLKMVTHVTTATMTLSGVDPGGGAWYQGTTPFAWNDFIIEFGAGVPANVSISPSANSVCAGTNITFTATPTNGGTSPSYQWYLNGSPVGSNSPTYSNSGLTNGNTVYCVMTSNLGGCVSNNPATSNTVTMIINTANLTFTTPANIVVNNAPGSCSAVVTYIVPTATTNTTVITPHTDTYNYSGSIVTWTVPAGVTSLDITAKGAQGGSNGGTGGSGAIMTGTFSVTPGQVLSILVGQQPTGGSFAAGGGGTFVALGATYSTATPLIVAGGGGGASSGTGGNASTGTSGLGNVPGTGGNGAPATSCGGGGGGFYTSGGNDTYYGAVGGRGFQQGGAGGTLSGYQTGGFGGGASADYIGSCNMQGGAGGGYSGGSAYNSTGYLTTGWGGGSYNGGTSQSNSVGNTGNGQVVINYNETTGSVVSATVTQTSGLASGATYPGGTTTNTYTATGSNGCTATTSFTVTVNDATAPLYIGTTVTGALCQSGNTYYVKSGTTFYVNIHHSDNCGSNYQYFEFTQQPNNNFGAWSLPNIKSYANPNGVAQNGYFSSFSDGMADNSQLDIQNSQCISTGNCNTDVNGKWQVVAGSGASTVYHITVYMYDQIWNGVGYTDTGLDLYLDNSAPTVPGTPYVTSGTGTNNQSWASTGSTDAGSGMNNYDWEWSYDGSTWNTWFTGSNSNSGTWACDQNVYIRTRSRDCVGNVSSWSAASSPVHTSYSSVAATGITGTTTLCSGGSTTLSVSGGSLGTGASWQWYSASCGAGSVGSGASIAVSPASTTTYYALATGSCNTTSCVSQTVTVNAPSATPASISGTNTICLGTGTTMNVAMPVTTNGGLLDYTTWLNGQTNSVGVFNENGGPNENYRINGTDPWGNTAVVWEARTDAASDADGGWNTNGIAIDNTKLYRFSVWINRTVTGNGYAYLGCSNVANLSDGSPNGNPYFWYSNTELNQNEWTLIVGFVYPYNYSGTTNNPLSGRYTVAGGRIGNTLNDFKWQSGATSTVHRTYLYYSTDVNTRQRWVYPRIDVVDGTEPSISQLLNGFDPNDGLGTGASWNWYTGSCGGTYVGTGTSLPVTPTSNTTYYICAVGACNTTPCASQLVTVSTPSATSPTSLSNGDYVWSGNTGLYWGSSSNWLTYNGSAFSVAGAIPTNANNVFIRAYLGCATNAAHIEAGHTEYCKNLTIETSLTMDNSSSVLNVLGNWTNNGIFTANNNTVFFKGSSAQTIGGSVPTTFYNLTIDNALGNAGGVTLNVSPAAPTIVTGALTLTKGKIITSSANLLTLNAGSSSTPGSSVSFVDGPMKKIGTTAFVFPTGDETTWARIAIGTPTASESFTAQYFRTGYGSYAISATTPFPLNNVSQIEYWTLGRAGTQNATVQLFSENAGTSVITDCSDLRIAHWCSSCNSGAGAWENNNDAVTTVFGACNTPISPTTQNGNIVSNAAVTSFSPFTFGSRRGANWLPIELLSFTAKCIGDKVTLDWSTSSETNNDYFSIDKSKNLADWYDVGTVAGSGTTNETSTYNTYDLSPFQGLSYYRLKQVDYDGTSETFGPAAVECTEVPDYTFEIIGTTFNENHDGITITYNVPEDCKVNITLIDALGQKIASTGNKSETGINTATVSISNELAYGLYIVTIEGNNKVFTQKVILH
jgi:hypothetical protein